MWFTGLHYVKCFPIAKQTEGYYNVCELSGKYGYCSDVTYTLGEGGA